MGLSHNTAPVDVRERHAFPAHTMGEALIALRDYEAVKEALMLQTCGRLEIYAELEDYEEGVKQIRQFLGNFRHGGVEDMDSYMYTLLGSQAVDHLFRVSTGLDSMLIGEAEILAQVKDAFVQGQRAQSLGKTLHSLFREALNAGKSARTHTDIGGQSVSIATAAVNFAEAHVGDIRGTSVVVVGAGKMGSRVARRFKHDGCREIWMLHRADLDSLTDAIAGADIVVTSTGAQNFVLTTENVGAAMSRRPERPLFIVDIAVPRDCDPDVAAIPGVRLVDVDGLRVVVDVTLERRREAIPMVEEIIAEHTERFHHWYQSRVAVPVISTLVNSAETLRERELQRLFARCPELTDREKMLITGMSLTIVSKLLHTPITNIRERALMLDELFDLK
jgi:glutamyl-tRNA reductase